MDINYAFDIDMIATELENAANLLRCFYEFWDNSILVFSNHESF